MSAEDGLTRVVHEVRELSLGEDTSYEAGRLTVGEESVLDLLARSRFRRGPAGRRLSRRLGADRRRARRRSALLQGAWRGWRVSRVARACDARRARDHARAARALPCSPPAFCPARRRRSSTCRGPLRRCRRSPRRTTSSSSGRLPRTRTGATSTWRCARGSSGSPPTSPRPRSMPSRTPSRRSREPGSSQERQAARRGHSQPSDPGQVQGRLRLRAQHVRRPARPSSRPASSTMGLS